MKVIKRKIDPDGYLRIEEKLDFPSGAEVVIMVELQEGRMTITLEEAKELLGNPPEITEEQWEQSRLAVEEMLANAGETGLPPDYADEIDHYLYGLPKRNQQYPRVGISLWEAKVWAKDSDERTEEQLAATKQIYEELGKGLDNLGLPDNLADELDHYLYGTPKRGEDEQG